MFRRDFLGLILSSLSFFGIKPKIPNGLKEVKIEDGEILNGEELMGEEPFRLDLYQPKLEEISPKRFAFFRTKKVWLNKKDTTSFNINLLREYNFMKMHNAPDTIYDNFFKKFYGEVLLCELMLVKEEGNLSNFYLRPMLSSILVDAKLNSNNKKYNFMPGRKNVKQIPNEGIKDLSLDKLFEKGE